MSGRGPIVLVHGFLFMAGDTEMPRQETRWEVYDHVRTYPGLHHSEIARQLGIPTNHAKDHLRRSENDGLVSSSKQDGYWRFFPQALLAVLPASRRQRRHA